MGLCERRRPPSGQGRHRHIVELGVDLDVHPHSPGCARTLVRAALGAELDPDAAMLVTSELVTNAIRHAHHTIQLRLSLLRDVIRLGVSDDGGRVPRRAGRLGTRRRWARSHSGRSLWPTLGSPAPGVRKDSLVRAAWRPPRRPADVTARDQAAPVLTRSRMLIPPAPEARLQGSPPTGFPRSDTRPEPALLAASSSPTKAAILVQVTFLATVAETVM
jgi:hypothetical protein